ncbi:DUF2971 domain-containing protein [Pseudomonas sp. Pse1]|uniref:DUF2971 domain-containing protein n=1 Tax=Pseudomonas sp. Pse1 TaxID=2926020 RepID=UPI002117B9FB|nr:DUF2971 domain-containing protein [Pseudomonas sp. Pse1]
MRFEIEGVFLLGCGHGIIPESDIVGGVGVSNTTKIRVYHFLNADYGIQNIEKRRIKISTLLGVNDPFELLGANVSNRGVRDLFTLVKREFDKEYGMLCFSKSNHSPVQWAHYGDRHTGVCLGFDVSADLLKDVHYVETRPDDFIFPVDPEGEMLWGERLLYTKYSHWSYEEEARAFVSLDKEEDGRYFKYFDDTVSLAEVLVGFNSNLSRAKVYQALGDIKNNVEVYKVRPAFQSFKMVRNLDDSQWK